LATYRLTHALPADHWTLLHGEPDDVLELAALLGLKFKEDANGQFAHSNIITILNGQGEIVHQQIGLNQDTKETVRILRQLAPK
jgi:protein SCO1/2